MKCQISNENTVFFFRDEIKVISETKRKLISWKADVINSLFQLSCCSRKIKTIYHRTLLSVDKYKFLVI